MDITIESVNAKLEKKEPLTKEESKFIMSLPPDNASDGNKVATEEEEAIDWPKEPEGEETPEKIKVKEEAKAAEEKKKVEEKALAEKKKEEDPKLDIERLEAELAKPEGKESLEGLTKREVAYFWSMRRDRRARQKAEEERDAAHFREIQHKNQEEAKAKEEIVEDPLKDLKEKDQEDYMTVADAVKILEKALKPAPKKEEPKATAIGPVHLKYLEFCDKEARSNHSEDYDAVMELASEIVNSNDAYVKEVGEAIAKGENPAEKTYQLIKQDPEFSKLFPAAETKVKARKVAEKKPEIKTPEELEKERKAKEAEDALEKNKEKPKTTGHVGGEGGGADETGKIDGYSVDDIYKMSDLHFAKLPKKTREKFLQQYG